MPDNTHTRGLLALLGPEVVQIGVAARFAASLDNSRLSFMPDAVVRPRDEEDIATLLRLANTHRVPVVPRGAGTATTGSASPLRGGWVLDMSGWRNLHIDAEAGVAYVQPGVVTAELASEAAKSGWFYPPDPSSDKYCTIGGNIACNAGGMRGAKYGVTRDYVMALEGFLPTGEWVRWGADLRKFAAGLNLRDLWIGSEGLLGVITGAVMRLVPAPQTRATFLCAFKDEEHALEVSRRIMASRLNPAIVEFLDRASVGCTIEEGLVLPFDAPMNSVPAVLLVELDGDAAQVQKASAALREFAAPNMAFVQATDAEQVQALWAVAGAARRRCSASLTASSTRMSSCRRVRRRNY
jgi:glycolate oxidase